MRRRRTAAARVRQPGGHADHVLLGDAYVHQTIREFLGETSQLAGADRIVADGHDACVSAASASSAAANASRQSLSAPGDDAGE